MCVHCLLRSTTLATPFTKPARLMNPGDCTTDNYIIRFVEEQGDFVVFETQSIRSEDYGEIYFRFWQRDYPVPIIQGSN